MPNNSLSASDYLLLLLYLENKKPILGAVRLIKMMFLFEKEISVELKKKNLDIRELPEFVAYDYGPFSRDVYEQIELFQSIKFIKVSNLNAQDNIDEADEWEETPYIDEFISQDDNFSMLRGGLTQQKQDGKYMKYEISILGSQYVSQRILPELNSDHLLLLSEFKKKITSLNTNQILKYVYTKYPEYTENSKIVQEVLGSEKISDQ